MSPGQPTSPQKDSQRGRSACWEGSFPSVPWQGAPHEAAWEGMKVEPGAIWAHWRARPAARLLHAPSAASAAVLVSVPSPFFVSLLPAPDLLA
jgi:hypothetical protein